MNYIRALVPRPQAPCLFVRPVGGARWCLTGFRSRLHLKKYLAGSDFLLLIFGPCDTWLITADGVPLEVHALP